MGIGNVESFLGGEGERVLFMFFLFSFNSGVTEEREREGTLI